MRARGLSSLPAVVLAAALVGLLLVPFVALVASSSIEDWRAGVTHPMFAPALRLSAWTSISSVLVILLAGTPLAWWIATSRSRIARIVEVLVELPIIVPPAVVGVALLQVFGRSGLLGDLGLGLAFTSAAVIVAQIVVAAPFFVQAAASAFREVDQDAVLVARSLGATREVAFLRVALPMASPGLITGASLAWARALGEFGATLLFAGNLTGVTQTLPLAVFSALEADVRLAVVFASVLAGVGVVLLLGLRGLPALIAGRSR